MISRSLRDLRAVLLTDPGRTAPVGVLVPCPCGCGRTAELVFEDPEDGGPSAASEGRPAWHRLGTTLDDLTLVPGFRIPLDPAEQLHARLTLSRGTVSASVLPDPDPFLPAPSAG